MKTVFFILIVVLFHVPVFLAFGTLSSLAANPAVPQDVFTQPPPIEKPQDVLRVLDNILRFFGLALGTISIGVIFWTGFLFLTAGGSEKRQSAAKKWLWWGIIGIVVALFAVVAPVLIRSFLSP